MWVYYLAQSQNQKSNFPSSSNSSKNELDKHDKTMCLEDLQNQKDSDIEILFCQVCNLTLVKVSDKLASFLLPLAGVALAWVHWVHPSFFKKVLL